MQTKYINEKNDPETEIDSQKRRIELLEKTNLDQEKTDMWHDQNFLQSVIHTTLKYFIMWTLAMN